MLVPCCTCGITFGEILCFALPSFMAAGPAFGMASCYSEWFSDLRDRSSWSFNWCVSNRPEEPVELDCGSVFCIELLEVSSWAVSDQRSWTSRVGKWYVLCLLLHGLAAGSAYCHLNCAFCYRFHWFLCCGSLQLQIMQLGVLIAHCSTGTSQINIISGRPCSSVFSML